MTPDQNEALLNFYASLDNLKKTGIIRSDVVWGDIGEFLCTVVYKELSLNSRKNHPNTDAMMGGKNIQIKFSNSSDTENIKLGNPNKYDEILVVLGKNSAHKKNNAPNCDFLFYRFTSDEVTQHFKITSGHTLSKTKHFKEHEFLLNLDRKNTP